MHIALFNFFYKPNPDYQNMTDGLRARGHTVWLGSRNPQGDLQWHDGERVVAVQAGPKRPSGLIRRIPLMSQLFNRIFFTLFMLRIRRFFRETKPDIVQMNPGALNFHWVLKVGMPQTMHFIFDIRHLNVGIRHDPIGKIREQIMVQSWTTNARNVFDHACFNHESTARVMLGPNWQRHATVVKVGLERRFLEAPLPPSAGLNPDAPLTFIYVGAFTRFRELERVFEAARLARETTDRFRIVLVGPDKTDGHYHRLAAEMGVLDVVELRPGVPYETVPDLMASFDVGLAYIPDRKTWHYQPTIKVLEYRALGLPILSIDVPSHRELVEEGVNGILTPNTVEGIADGIVRFATDRAFWAACRDRAQQMRTGLLIEDVAEMYEAIYLKLKRQDAQLEPETAVLPTQQA